VAKKFQEFRSPVLASFASALRSRLDLVFEHLALSHQMMVLRRSRRKAQFSGADRCFWILLPALWDRWPKSLMISKPANLLDRLEEFDWSILAFLNNQSEQDFRMIKVRQKTTGVLPHSPRTADVLSHSQLSEHLP